MTLQTNALLYLRTASANDADVARQHQRCAEYAEARGWPVLDVIVDNGVSRLADRLGLSVLWDRIASGEAQAVIATDVARMSRDPDQVNAFARFYRHHGADLRFADQPDSLDCLRKIPTDVRVPDADMDQWDGDAATFRAVEFRQ